MCDVTVSNTRVISSSYMATTPTAQSVTRGTGAVGNVYGETANTLTISTGKDILMVVDLADLAQSPWTKPVDIFDRIGSILNESIEAGVLGQYASWTNFGDTGGGALGISSTAFTVSASNIDDIIRGVKREIRVANGNSLMNRNGVGFVWRPQDFEYLEAFVQANGFMTADNALKNGTDQGLNYLQATHYFSNDYTAGHVFAGVRKIQRLGILQGTYGRAHTIEFPAADSNTFFSGVGYYSRVDFGHLTPTGLASIIFNVNVN